MRVGRTPSITSYNEVVYVDGKEVEDIQASAFHEGNWWVADVWNPETGKFVIMGEYATRKEAEAHAEALYLSGVWK